MTTDPCRGPGASRSSELLRGLAYYCGLTLLLGSLFLASCAGSREQTKAEESGSSEKDAIMQADVQDAAINSKADKLEETAVQDDSRQIKPPPAPSTCGIRGEIVKIDTARRWNSNERDPCYYAPCRARVLLEDVGRCGRDMQVHLMPGDTVWISFSYTLFPTAMLPIAVGQPLPGLIPGDRFVAQVSSRIMPHDQPPSLEVDVYRRIGY